MVIDVDKFVASIIKHYCEAHSIDRISTRCWFDDVLEEQGLEYKDWEIVKTQRRIAAEAKETIFDDEDEKIRKELIDYHRSMAAASDDYVHEVWIAWLEKQGENTLIEEIKRRKELYSQEKEKAVSPLEKLSLGGRIAVLEELLVFVKEKQGELTQPVTKISEQVWSEEDEENLQHCCGAVYAADYYTLEDKEQMEAWLKSLKERLGGK